LWIRRSWISPRQTRNTVVQPKRIILTFKDGETVIHALYQRKDGPNPNTKARLRELVGLTQRGLRDALEALQSRPAVCEGTSGFVERQDILSVNTRATEKVSA
jgi:hypothetical protein